MKSPLATSTSNALVALFAPVMSMLYSRSGETRLCISLETLMNFVFVNHVHPETTHVSSMRMRLFADALTRRGHRVVLLTAPHERSDAVATPAEAERSLMSHDWRAPFQLSCPPISNWRDTAARSPTLPRALR